MTATSLIVQRSRVSLITDAAFYYDNGCIAAIASKVAIEPRLRMAIAVSGSIQGYHVAVGLDGVASQTEALQRLPEFSQAFRHEKAISQPLGEASGVNEFTLFVAMWSDQTDRPEGWIYSSTRGFLGSAYRPGTLVEVELVQLPTVDGWSFDLDTFDPITDGRAMLEAQRQIKHPANGQFQVGGFGEATIIDRCGVQRHRLIDWPDTVGECIADRPATAAPERATA